MKKMVSLFFLMALSAAGNLFAADNAHPEIDAIAKSPISAAEKAGLLYMYEEEKLARDVYRALYEKWDERVFSNITRSEEQHMASIEYLLDRYEIANPAKDLAEGRFKNTELQRLYSELVAQGSTSREEAFKVGAAIEELDIADLVEYIKKSDNEDIDFVYTNLKKGSENHLRAFSRQLVRYGQSYSPRHISKAEYAAIVDSDGGSRKNSRQAGDGYGRRTNK